MSDSQRVMRGSCNAEIFEVHDGMRNIHAAGGDGASWSEWANPISIQWEEGNFIRSQRKLANWVWEYPVDVNYAATIYVLGVPAAKPRLVWEAETALTTMIRTKDLHNQDIIETGESYMTLKITGAVVSALYSEYSANADDIDTNYREKLVRRGISHTKTIDDALAYGGYPEAEKTLNVLLWLRSASQVEYAHSGESCIPLVLDRFYVDQYGEVSLT